MARKLYAYETIQDGHTVGDVVAAGAARPGAGVVSSPAIRAGVRRREEKFGWPHNYFDFYGEGGL
jgi:hypothetical protein